MKISCPSCSAKYSISDEKVVSRLAKIRCRKCGATIVIDGKVNPPTVTATAGGGGDTGDDHAVQEHTEGGPEYSVDLGEGDQRTMPLSDIVAAYNAGQITGETFVWADGFADWKALSEVQEIVDALHAAADGGRPASSPQAASPWDAKPQAAAPAPSPVRAAARPARAAAGDLFGRIDRAGSEEDVATSAPDPGLGGGGGGGGGGTGARNESSVLFSLSALTSASSPSKPTAGPSRVSSGGPSTTASRDDSGLIDLKALTAAAVKSDGAAPPPMMAAPALSPLAASPLGVAAPLGLGSPLGGGLVSSDLGPPQKSKTGLFIAIAIVAAAVIVAVAVILKPTPPPPIVAAPPPPPPPAAAPAPTPTPTLAAAPPPTGSAESESPTAKKSGTTAYRRPGGTAKKPQGGTSTGGGSEPAAAPAKPKSKCGCSAGDLQCAMRCAAKGG